MISRTLSHYRILAKLGSGGVGEVYLGDARCPIIGDHKYGARTNPARRLGLHASSLQFKHPLSEELLRFESPLPQDLARLL